LGNQHEIREELSDLFVMSLSEAADGGVVDLVSFSKPNKVASESQGVFEGSAAVNSNESSVDDDADNDAGMDRGLADVTRIDAFEGGPVNFAEELVKDPGRVVEADEVVNQRW
jgi:hypothetical protein